MSVKVSCPKCRAEIADPADPKNVPCPACGITFSSVATSKLVWTLAAILVACTLVAMWSTAARVKARKLAARQGERIEAPIVPVEKPRLRLSAPTLDEILSKAPQGESIDVEIDAGASLQRQEEVLEAAAKRGVTVRFVVGDARPSKLQLRRGQQINFEHFIFQFRPTADPLSLLDAQGRPLVNFLRLKKGQQRGWQELRLSVLEVEQELITLLIELRPGASSFGGGGYYVLRAGLRVEFGLQLSATVLAWDPSKSELKLRIETQGHPEELTLPANSFGESGGIRYGLRKDAEGRWVLLLDSAE